VSEYFTDDDVTAASSAFIKIWWSDGHVETDEAMTAVLSAVAPSIAARALREAADDNTNDIRMAWDAGIPGIRDWLRARADAEETTP
jgi:hypothetical protein